MKKHGICEKPIRETAKSCEINALGFKETSSYGQMTSSKSYKRDVVEAYRLDRYDNLCFYVQQVHCRRVVEAYRLDRYDNFGLTFGPTQ